MKTIGKGRIMLLKRMQLYYKLKGKVVLKKIKFTSYPTRFACHPSPWRTWVCEVSFLTSEINPKLIYYSKYITLLITPILPGEEMFF